VFNSYNHYIKLEDFFLMIKKKVLQTQITFHELNEIQLKWVYEIGLAKISIKKTRILAHLRVLL